MPRAGFTLIEMLVVIAMIAVLALMAGPVYTDKIVREQVAAALPLASLAKAPVESAWSLTQTFPADNAAAGIPAADHIVSNVVSALTVQDGAIHITFGNRASALLKGKILTLRPAVIDDTPLVPVAWVCGYAPAPDKMTVHGNNLTSVPGGQLPISCRAGN